MAWKKLSDDVAKPDRPLASFAGFRLVENLEALSQDLIVECAHAYDGTNISNRAPPTFSTNPGEWWGIPLILPIARGLNVATVHLHYEVAEASVDCALWCDGRLGTDVELTTTSGVTRASVSVGLNDSRPRDAVAMLCFRSRPKASPYALLNSVSDLRFGARGWAVSAHLSSGSIHGKCHYAFDTRERLGRWVYVGAGESGGAQTLTIWPREDGLAAADAIYELGRCTLYGFGVVMTQAANHSFPVPSTDAVRVGMPVRAQDFAQWSRLQWELYRDRATWHACAPTPRGSSGFHGVSLASGNDVAGTLVRAEKSSDGLRVTLLGTSENGVVDGGTAALRNIDGTATSSAMLQSAQDGSRPSYDLLSFVAPLCNTGAQWGSVDLVPLSEVRHLTTMTADLWWPDTYTEGQLFKVRVYDVTLLHTHAASIRTLRPWLAPNYIAPP